MPFTLSHAAVVLPFSRLLARRRLLSAVVIGSMVPDFGLFLPWHMRRFETHSVEALFTFCLPVGLAAYWVFQYVVKTPLVELLPEGAYARWRPYSAPAKFGDLLQWLLAACGVLAGALTHLVWDAFTHEGARGVRMIPWLEDPVLDINNHHVMAFRLMQDGSSLLGLMVVLGFIAYGLRRGHDHAVPKRPLRPGERRAWISCYTLAVIVSGAAWFLWARAEELIGHSVTFLASGIAVAALRGLAVATLVTSVLLGWRLRARRR
jgi:uncharacterized protein DUF4184